MYLSKEATISKQAIDLILSCLSDHSPRRFNESYRQTSMNWEVSKLPPPRQE